MKLAALFSGGKDSMYAVFKTAPDVKYLVTAFSKSAESYMFHYANVELTKEQAQLMKKAHIIFHTAGEKEKELADLKRCLSLLNIDGVVSGALASNYQRSRIDKICEELGLKHVAPLWGLDQEQHLRNLIRDKFDVVITSVSAAGFDRSWLGRHIDEQCIADLKKLHEKYKISISGDGGEYCSLVLNCPLFLGPLQIKSQKVIWRGDSGWLQIKI